MNYKIEDLVDNPGTARLLEDVMNYEPESKTYPLLVRVLIWTILWFLGAFALVCGGWITWSIIKFALNGFAVNPF